MKLQKSLKNKNLSMRKFKATCRLVLDSQSIVDHRQISMFKNSSNSKNNSSLLKASLNFSQKVDYARVKFLLLSKKKPMLSFLTFTFIKLRLNMLVRRVWK